MPVHESTYDQKTAFSKFSSTRGNFYVDSFSILTLFFLIFFKDWKSLSLFLVCYVLFCFIGVKIIQKNSERGLVILKIVRIKF